MARTNESISLDKKVTVHGIEIRKMPNGRYLSALALIKELPETFVKEVLEGETDFKLSDIFTVEKFIEINKIDVFFTRMKPVVARLMNLQTPTGFNTQLQTA